MMIPTSLKGPWEERRLGLTTVTVRVGKVGGRKQVDVDMLVDSGAIYAVLAATTLREVGIHPHSRETFGLADGTRVEREVGSAFFELGDRKDAAPVVFGSPATRACWGPSRSKRSASRSTRCVVS